MVRERAGLTVADDNCEALADEHLDLAELDGFGLVDVAGGLQHDEQRLAVHLEFRPLVRLDSVFDRELVESERLSDVRELLGHGFVQADPCEDVGAEARRRRVVDRDRAVSTPAGCSSHQINAAASCRASAARSGCAATSRPARLRTSSVGETVSASSTMARNRLRALLRTGAGSGVSR